MAYTLQVGRKEFEHRRAVVCRTVGEAIVALESVGQQALTGRIRAEFGEMELWVDADRLTVGCRGAALGEAAEWKGEREEQNLGALLETVGRLWVAGAVVEVERFVWTRAAAACAIADVPF